MIRIDLREIRSRTTAGSGSRPTAGEGTHRVRWRTAIHGATMACSWPISKHRRAAISCCPSWRTPFWREGRAFFSSHRYPGLLFPPDQPVLEEFLLDLCPSFTSRAGRIPVKKSILMPHGKENPARPLRPGTVSAGRHPPPETFPRLPGSSRTRPRKRFPPRPGGRDRKRFPDRTLRGHAIPCRPDLPGVAIHPFPLWYNRFQYMEERERGFDWEEDLFLPGIIEVPVERKCTVILSVC